MLPSLVHLGLFVVMINVIAIDGVANESFVSIISSLHSKTWPFIVSPNYNQYFLRLKFA